MDDGDRLFGLLTALERRLSEPPSHDPRFDVLVAKVEGICDRLDTLHEDLKEVKEALYEPDVGLYARLKMAEKKDADANEAIKNRLEDLENSGKVRAKLFWVGLPMVLTLFAKALVELIVRHVVLS